MIPQVQIGQDGTKFEPWQSEDGCQVGFKITRPDGQVKYLYLNPSTEWEEGGSPDVFVYTGPAGNPALDGTVVFVEV